MLFKQSGLTIVVMCWVLMFEIIHKWETRDVPSLSPESVGV